MLFRSIANNKDITAQTTFSSSASSVLIYEIDENTIGVKADSDDNGTFETEVKTNSKSISGCKVELSARKFSYDGNEQKPLLKVTENGNTLAENKDYTVTYENSYGEWLFRRQPFREFYKRIQPLDCVFPAGNHRHKNDRRNFAFCGKQRRYV